MHVVAVGLGVVHVLSGLPRRSKHTEYGPIRSAPDHHDRQFQMISWTPMRRASACSLPALSGASSRPISFRRTPVGGLAHVQVPVDRAPLRVEAVAVTQASNTYS